MSKAKLAIALSTLSVVAIVAWAVPIKGIAHQRVQRRERQWFDAPMPVAPIRLRDEQRWACWQADGSMARVRLSLRSTPAPVFHLSAAASSSGRGFK